MFSFRRWLLCGAVFMVITSCSSAAAPTSTVSSTTTVALEAYRIGDVGPAGGTVFITPSTSGNTTGRYFEAAPFSSEVKRWWAASTNEDLSVPGASGTAIGDGAANTAAIASQVGNVAEYSAAGYASQYSFNGFSDWFLPSKDELNELYKSRRSVGGFSSEGYWSSSEYVDFAAWVQVSTVGMQSRGNKTNDMYYVRPVRAFNALTPTTAATTTVAPISTPTVALKSYRVKDVGPAGGSIFITPSTPGNTSGLYFEVAPRGSEVVRTWATSTNGNLSVSGASGRAIGNGAANTAAIASQVGNVAEYSAAGYASQYSFNGFSDWFLPSKDELNEVYKTFSVGFFSTDFHWSSSEFGANQASRHDFFTGLQDNVSKNFQAIVLPLRAFNASTSTAATTATVVPEAYRIGDVGPAGGTVFITPSTSGNTTGRYFEAAPFSSEVKRWWAASTNEDLSVPGASGTAIGDGAANTAAIARQVGNVAEYSAAGYASQYSFNGFSDWFLPSKDELNELFKSRDIIGGFSSDYFWSSSELDANAAWVQYFDVGIQFYYFKGNALYVRPVRAFD